MRRPGISSLTIVALVAAAAPAAAEPVKLVKGPAADRDAIVGAVEKARAQMAVCWQRTPPATVRIKLEVAASGEVTSAKAETKGAAAQCAAGILAVSTLAPSKKAWKGEVELVPAAPGKAQDARAIHDALVGHAPALMGCQQEEPGFVGKVLLRVTVRKDGAVTAASADVTEATAGAGKAVAACAAKRARGLTLVAIASDSLTYELQVGYAGGSAPAEASDAIPLAGQPASKGALTSQEIAAAIDGRRASIRACLDRPRKHGKVVVRFEIGADGKVAKASIKSSEIDDPKTEECLTKAFRAIVFPASTGASVVHYPILVGR